MVTRIPRCYTQYIENSLTTLIKKILCQKKILDFGNTDLDSDKEIARKRKRKLSYFSNILVVSDPKHPENEEQSVLI